MERLQAQTHSPALLSSNKTLSSTQAKDKRKDPPILFNVLNKIPLQAMSTNQFLTFDAAHLQLGGGVAIFHLASSRVVVCRHTVRDYWFLPKGRRDAGEESGIGAEREGYEEVRFVYWPDRASATPMWKLGNQPASQPKKKKFSSSDIY